MTRDGRRLVTAVNQFAKVMKEKLLTKAAEGWRGWDCDGYQGLFLQKLHEHELQLQRGDMTQAVDVANFAMMLWALDQEFAASDGGEE